MSETIKIDDTSFDAFSVALAEAPEPTRKLIDLLRTDRDRLARELADTLAQLVTVRAERDAMERERDAYAKRAREWQHNHDERMKERDFLGAARDALRAKLQAAEERAGSMERELTEMVDAVIGAPQNTAVIAAVEQRIAAFVRAEANHDGGWGRLYAERIEDGAWRQKEGS